MDRSPTRYDTFAYRGFAYMETHPSRLATMASFYGMDPVPPARCRVLELGCGVGANIIPMAIQYPDSEFLGVDLSGRSIEAGSGVIAALGLKNVTLRHASITDVTPDYGLFDYVVSHGVYSWVPPEVRDKMMAVFHANMASRGVAYVSYNAHPGSHLRDMVRDMMLFHVRDVTDPQQRVEQARAMLKALAEASIKTSVHGVVLRDQLARVERLGNDVLFHDDLDEGAVPFLLYQVVESAQRHGLQYLCDASLWRRAVERLPENMQALLSQFTPGAYMARDQYHDFIDGHGFRRTLLCHGEVQLDRNVQPSLIRRHHLSSSAQAPPPEIDPTTPDTVEFKTEAGDTLATDHPLTKAMLMQLNQHWPGAIGFEALLANARARLSGRPELCTDEHVEAMTGAIFHAACSGHIEFYLHPPYCLTALSERPQVSPLIRKQLEFGTMVTSLRHDAVLLEDATMRRFINLVDGSRDLDQLTVDFAAEVAQISPQSGHVVTREIVEHNLKMLAKLALLIG